MAALMGSKLMRGKRGGGGLRALGLGVAVLLGVSACSGPPETPAQTSIPMGTPTPLASSPTASPSGSPAASSSPSNAYVPATSTSPAKNVPKPVLPALAKKKTFEGQKAFIKYWFETFSYAFETGNTGPLRGVSAPDCRLCKLGINGADEMYSKKATWRVSEGTHVETDSIIRLPDFNGLSVSRGNVIDYKMQFWTSDGPSKSYKSTNQAKNSTRFWLEYVDGQWRMVDARKEAK